MNASDVITLVKMNFEYCSEDVYVIKAYFLNKCKSNQVLGSDLEGYFL